MCGKYKNNILYDSDSGSGQQLHFQSSPGNVAVVGGQRNGRFSQNGKLGNSCVRVTKSKLYDSQVRDHAVHSDLNVKNSAHICRYIVCSSGTVAAI